MASFRDPPAEIYPAVRVPTTQPFPLSFWPFLSHPPNNHSSSHRTSPRYPFDTVQRNNLKMGYDKTDELTINTIRVLAVSLIPRLTALRASSLSTSCPSTVNTSLDSDVFHDAHHHHTHSQTPQNGQLLTIFPYLGRCNRSCKLRSPRCAHVRFCPSCSS